MIADRLGVSVPAEYGPELWDWLRDRSTVVTADLVADNLIRVDGGTLKHFPQKAYHHFSFSGQYLDYLRQYREFDAHLWRLAEVPHKVTTLHIAYDVRESAEPHLKRILRLGRSGKAQLSRKAIPAKHIDFFDRYNYSNPELKTGTAYIGNKMAEVRLAVYDKRNERIDKGANDPGPLTRYELRIKDVGATLRDVALPESLFWHYMHRVLKPPGGVSPWVPNAEGYVLHKPEELLPFQIMQRRLDSSPDVDHLLSLADRMGPNGLQTLQRLLEKKHRTLTANRSDSVVAAFGDAQKETA